MLTDSDPGHRAQASRGLGLDPHAVPGQLRRTRYCLQRAWLPHQRFKKSFWITAAAVRDRDLGQVPNYVDVWGLRIAFPFLVIVILLLIRGQGLPVRGQVVERLSGSARPSVHWWWLFGSVTSFRIAQVFWFDTALVDALRSRSAGRSRYSRSSCCSATRASSRSPGFALAGLAALISARLVAERGWPFELAVLAAVGCTIPIGLLFAIPALGRAASTLAVVTLGLAMSVNAMVFTNTRWVGADGFTVVGGQTYFGIDIGPITPASGTGSSSSASRPLRALGGEHPPGRRRPAVDRRADEQAPRPRSGSACSG